MFQFIIITSLIIISAGQKCEKEIENKIIVDGTKELRSLIIWFPANIGAHNIYDQCSQATGKPLERSCSKESGTAKWIETNKSDKYVKCTDIRKCEDETFEHYYQKKDNNVEKYRNKWQAAEVDKVGYLEKPCYLKTRLLTRQCKYNTIKHKTEWEKSHEEKDDLVCWEEKEILKQENLFSLKTEVTNLKLNKTKPNIAINNVIHFLENDKENITTAHIHDVYDIMKVVIDKDENQQLVPDILNLTNSLLETKPEVFKDSKNASEIFPLIDTYLNKMAKQLVPTDKCESINDGIYMTTVASASLFYINPLCSNISGVAIFNSGNSSAIKPRLYDQHSNNYYHFVYLNQSLNELLEESDLKIATYFPLKLWNSIIKTTDTKNDTILKIMLFKNDVLFVNQTAMEQKPMKSVLEITVIDYKEKLPSDLPFIFNNLYHKKLAKPDCGFWNKTTWITTGINTSHIINRLSEHLLLCNTTHLTPFSALLNLELIDTFDDSALDMISVLGCGLSLFGLICIWLTAACIPKWREQSTNKVLLNICFVLTLIMIFFLLLNMPDFKTDILDIDNYMNCLLMGAFLQYIVLVLFMWMLFIAVIQYHRLVKVFNSDIEGHVLRKFFILSWGLPLIPTLLVVHFQPNAYMPNHKSKSENNAICYPSGYSFYLGVMLPMVIIIVSNICIFTKIILGILQSNIEFKNQRTRKQKLTQVYVSILLFFLLGISWIFGILAHLESSPVFSYMFCLTSTLQGFVMFIYLIVINKKTRLTWLNLICGLQSSQTTSR